MIRSPALKRYNQRVLWLSLVYAGLLLGAGYGFRHGLVPTLLRFPVAILPALPIVGIFAAIGRYLVEEQDEFVRMLMVRATLFASGFALSLATIWGFLESFDQVPHIDAYYAAVTWFLGLGIGGLINRFTVGTGNC